MSNNGPRFQARQSPHKIFMVGEIGGAFVMDTSLRGQKIVAAANDIESAIIIARALNRDVMS